MTVMQLLSAILW